MEEYIGACLDSLIVPEIDNLDILVINDGSKDNSSTIAREYERRYPNSIKVVDKDNGNYGSCINRGLKEAKGKFVKILDADDTFDKNLFSHYIRLLSESDADAVVNDYVQVDTEGKALKRLSFDTLNPNIVSPVKELIDQFPYDSMAMHAIAFRTYIFNSIEYHQSEGISYTDDEWIFIPFIGVKTIQYFSLPIYRYLIGRQGQTIDQQIVLHKIDHIARIVSKMIELYETSGTLDKFHDKYLIHRIERKKNILYYLCIIFNNKVRGVDIRDFDSELKIKHPFFYNLFENDTIRIFKLLRIKHIKIWRDSGFNAYPLKLVRFWVKLLNILK